MSPGDMVYNAIYKGAIKAGATEKASKDQAVIGLQMFRRGQFKKAIDLIDERIKAAKAQGNEKKKATK